MWRREQRTGLEGHRYVVGDKQSGRPWEEEKRKSERSVGMQHGKKRHGRKMGDPSGLIA